MRLEASSFEMFQTAADTGTNGAAIMLDLFRHIAWAAQLFQAAFALEPTGLGQFLNR
jgi:hypothetical protein